MMGPSLFKKGYEMSIPAVLGEAKRTAVAMATTAVTDDALAEASLLSLTNTDPTGTASQRLLADIQELEPLPIHETSSEFRKQVNQALDQIDNDVLAERNQQTATSIFAIPSKAASADAASTSIVQH